MEKLTERQREILSYITSFLEESGRSPSLREIGEEFSISPAGVHYVLKALEKKGALTTGGGKARSIALSQAERDLKENVRIPFFPKEPSPLELEREPEEFWYLSRSVAEKGMFAFRVTSYSMANGGILPGDIAILKRTNKAQDGAVVLATLPYEEDKEMELRRYRKGRETSELWPENDSMGIIRSQNIHLCAILFEIRRSY